MFKLSRDVHRGSKAHSVGRELVMVRGFTFSVFESQENILMPPGHSGKIPLNNVNHVIRVITERKRCGMAGIRVINDNGKTADIFGNSPNLEVVSLVEKLHSCFQPGRGFQGCLNSLNEAAPELTTNRFARD